MQLSELLPQHWLLLCLISLCVGVAVAVIFLRLKYSSRWELAQDRHQSLSHELGNYKSKLEDAERSLSELRHTLQQHSIASAESNARFSALQDENQRLIQQEQQQRQENKQHRDEIIQAKEQLSRTQAQLQAEREQAAEKLAVLNGARQQLTAEFKNLANDIFEDKSKRFTEQNKLNIETILKPLSGQISDFQKRVEDSYEKESKDRFSLVKEIKNLQDLNNRISQDAVNLTNALRGESKTQGSWGELKLELILEASGLTKGQEYDVQVSTRGDSGERLQPDVVVHLPENKDVIIDSKASLTAYYSYCSAELESERESAAKLHVQSVQNHIRNLSAKEYQKLPDVRTLDFVLMFLPLEDAFNMAVQRDPQLFAQAFSKNIIMVGPSTLLATLKTIQHIWRNEYQSRNALEIARRAGDLYDKFVNFIADLDEIGQRLDKAQEAYHKAHNKLASGRGNLVGRAEKLKRLGAKTSKQLPHNLVERSDEYTELLSDSETEPSAD